MRRILKWIGVILAGLVGLLVLALVVLYILGSSRLDKAYDIQAETFTIPSGAAAVARGQHLSEAVTFCQACHGEDLGGTVLEEAPGMYILSASNLTAGRGGVGATYSDADYLRAIRHGVNPEGRGLILMHSDIYHNLSQQDLGAVIAYLKSVPPVDNEIPKTKVEPLGRFLVALGMFDTEAYPLIPAEVIDHAAPFSEMPTAGATVEYGGYLMSITLCQMCHGSDLTGAAPLEEGMPPGPNITTAGELGVWSEAEFIKTMRTGVSPHGHELDPEFMPWDVYAKMTDDELRALWLYIQSLPALEPAE